MRFSVFFLLTAATAANAGVVTIDAASFSVGADITHATPGITLQEVTNYGLGTSYTLNPVYIVPNTSGLPVGPNFVGHNNADPWVLRWDFRNNPDAVRCYTAGTCISGPDYEFNGLLMIFQYPTDFIEMRVHKTDNDVDWSYLRLYNRQRQLLASCYVSGADTPRAPHYAPKLVTCGAVVRLYDCTSSGRFCDSEIRVTINRSYPDVAFAIWGGEAFNSTRGAIDRISFRRFGDCGP